MLSTSVMSSASVSVSVSVATSKMISASKEGSMRKKVVDSHDSDGTVSFDSKAVLVLIERISYILTSGRDGMPNGPISDYAVPGGLHSILYEISCVLNCKCLGGDIEASAMEILKVVSTYEWEAKIAIVLASLVVEYAQFSHMITTLYTNNNPLGELVGILKKIPAGAYEENLKSRLKGIIDVSVKVARSIAEFGNLSSKYISKDVQHMADAIYQTPEAVHLIIKVVVAWAFHLSQTLAHTTSTATSETVDFTILEQTINTIYETLSEQHRQCLIYIEEKKQEKHIIDLRLKFDKTSGYKNNQKVLQLLIKNKDTTLPPIARCDDKTTAVGVDALKGHTVLLYISDLKISDDEISILNSFYQSRKKYEIVWLPIVEEWDDEKFEALKLKMTWYSVQQREFVRSGVARFVREDWHYSDKSILVALDPRGKVANLNAFQMLWTWGNVAYPFTQSYELDIWQSTTWNLKFIIGEIDSDISGWIKEDKVICLYSGDESKWIESFVSRAREVESAAGINLEMVYIGGDVGTKVAKDLNGHSSSWKAEYTDTFLSRIQGMGRLEGHVQSSKVSKEKASLVAQVRHIDRLRQSQEGWALISQGAGMAQGKHDVMLKAFQEFDKWKAEAKGKGFVVALNDYLGDPKSIIPHVCDTCHQPIN